MKQRNIFSALLSITLAMLAGFAATSMGIFDPEVAMAAVGAGVVVSTDPDRAAYSRFEQVLSEMGVVSGGATPIITQTDLRLEMSLSPSKNSYRFDLREGTSSTDRPNENKLNVSDIFMVTAIGIGVFKDNGDKVIYHYPDPNYFAAANEKGSLEQIYNGKLSLSTGQTQRINEILTHHMRYVPPVQKVSVAQSGEANDNDPSYGPLLEDRGYHRIHPNIIIDGSKQNFFNLALGDGTPTAIDGAANDNIVTLLLHGFLYSGKVADDSCMV